jgi:hypothetical protein
MKNILIHETVDVDCIIVSSRDYIKIVYQKIRTATVDSLGKKSSLIIVISIRTRHGLITYREALIGPT